MAPMETAASLSSPSSSMMSPRNGSHRISAAADLIRNLDAALSGMNAAAASAAEDAARARRNARVAGELARRYGGGSTNAESMGVKVGRKKRGDRVSEGGTGGSSLLERKRERRAAARMAAEARQRKDYPISYSPRSFVTPRSTRGIVGKGLFFGEGAPSSAANNNANGLADLVDSGVAGDLASSAEDKRRQKAVGFEDVKKCNAGSDSFGGGVMESALQAGTNDAPFDPISIMDTNETEFQDAVDKVPVYFLGSAEEKGAKVSQEIPRRTDDVTGASQQIANGWTEDLPSCPHKSTGHGDEDGGPPTFTPQTDQPLELQRQQLKLEPTASGKAATDPTDTHPKQHSMLRGQPPRNNRIEASHAEDVLTLSLELEQIRSQLQSTEAKLCHVSEQANALKGQNDHLNSEIGHLHSQLETHNERSSTQLSLVQEKLDAEQLKANAAEEDAALALELAKESQASKEECEMWLTRSLEEIDIWKGRCGDLERQLKEQRQQDKREKNKVRWKDDCPPSPVVSEDGGFGGDDVSPSAWHSPKSPLIGATAAINNRVIDDRINRGETFASPASIPTRTSAEATPLKSAIASGRALLHRASPSPNKDASFAGGLSPHPRLQASELLRKSAETRRLLREKLNSERSGMATPKPPASTAKGQQRQHSLDPAHKEKENKVSKNNEGGDDRSFASRQGAACRAVGRVIRESGLRLKLDGRWWDQAKFLTNGAVASAFEGGTVTQLESMVNDYCAGVECVVGVQRERIENLLSFCDYLEKEVVPPPR